MFEEERFTTAMLGRANCSLKPDKKLLNSKFEQYKYTSGRLPNLALCLFRIYYILLSFRYIVTLSYWLVGQTYLAIVIFFHYLTKNIVSQRLENLMTYVLV